MRTACSSKADPCSYSQRGLSRLETLILIVITLPVLLQVVPNLFVSRQAANEASAISIVRTIGTAQAIYQSTVGNGVDFAGADGSVLAELYAHELIDEALASGTKSGYHFICISYKGDKMMSIGFETFALPESSGLFGTGNRSFYSNESYVIYQQRSRYLSDWSVERPPGRRVPAFPADPIL
jgi:hypothetical protein